MDKLSRRDREKLAREEEMISAAEQLFSQRGFDKVSMDEIAKESQFTKRTLYQYFESKEEIYFGVVVRGFQKIFVKLEEASNETQTGFMRLQQSCSHLYQFNKDHPEIFRIIGYTGYVKKKAVAESKRYREFLQWNSRVFEIVAKMIEEGKKDGSIQGNLDSQTTSYSLIFLLTGFFNQLSATGDSFTEHFSTNMDDFGMGTIDLLMQTFKNK